MAGVEGESAEPPRRLNVTRSAPTQSTPPSPHSEEQQRPARSTPSPPLLHQMVRQVCEAVGETWRNSLQQHIQSSLNALGPAPQPLHERSPPRVSQSSLFPATQPPPHAAPPPSPPLSPISLWSILTHISRAPRQVPLRAKHESSLNALVPAPQPLHERSPPRVSYSSLFTAP